MESKKKVKKSRLIYISIVVVLLLLQVIAWNSRSFSDAYIAYIFPIWVNTYGRITGSFPFSVGECGGDRCCNISGSAGDQYDLSGMQAFGKVLSRC